MADKETQPDPVQVTQADRDCRAELERHAYGDDGGNGYLRDSALPVIARHRLSHTKASEKYPGLDHIANFINSLDTEGMTANEVRSAIYAECITPGEASTPASDGLVGEFPLAYSGPVVSIDQYERIQGDWAVCEPAEIRRDVDDGEQIAAVAVTTDPDIASQTAQFIALCINNKSRILAALKEGTDHG